MSKRSQNVGYGHRQSGTRPLASAPLAFLLIAATLAPLFAVPALGATAGEWLPPLIVDSAALAATSSEVAFDGAGNAIVAWSQFDGTFTNIWTSRYDAIAGWGTPNVIESNDDGNARRPQVAFDGLGGTLVVWEHSDATRYSIWANHHSSDWGWGKWGDPELLETNDAGGASFLQLASNGRGELIAAWQQYDGFQNSIYANRYAAASGWSGAELVETNDSASGRAPQVAIGANGDAVVLWPQTAAHTDHWASFYEAGVGWGNATMIQASSGPGNDTAGYDVAIGPSGQAVAVWSQADATREDLWSNTYTPGSGWGTARTIESESTFAESPALAIDGLGNALAIWYQGTGLVGTIHANRFDSLAGGWGNAQSISGPWNPSLEQPVVASSPAGDAVAVWTAPSAGRNSIFATRFTPIIGWAAPEFLEFNDTYDANRPQAAVDHAGNAMVTWEQSDITAPRIWADRFAIIDVTAPLLSIVTPGDGIVTNRTTIWVSGFVEPGAAVSVNGVSAAVGSDGSWGMLAGLQAGPNRIVVTATDRAGNRADTAVSIHLDDPALGLASDLADARTRIVALEETVEATEALLVGARADLAAAQTRMAALDAEGNASQGALETARADLAAAGVRLSALEVNFASAKRDLVVAAADLRAAEARVATLENISDASASELSNARALSTAASAQAALATILGEMGLLLGTAAVFIALRGKRILAPAEPKKTEAAKKAEEGEKVEKPPKDGDVRPTEA